MAVIAIVAVNCAAVRASYSGIANEALPGMLVGGLLPLVNAFFISLYLIAKRYRFSLRRRKQDWHGRFIVVFSAFTALALTTLLVACVFATSYVHEYAEGAFAPFEPWPRWFDETFFRLVFLPIFLGVVLSGPPLLLALTVGFVSSRLELVVATRAGRLNDD
jgi:hypothetical protein